MPMPTPKEVTETKSVVIVVGDTASFGYSSYRPTQDDSLTWWSLYETKEPPAQKQVPPEFVSTMLQDMYGSWAEHNVQKMIKSATAPFIYPIWTVPELPTWGDSGIVLIPKHLRLFLVPRVAKMKLLNVQAQSKAVTRNKWMMPKLAWIREFELLSICDLTYGDGHRTDEILFGWDVEKEIQKVFEKI
ncbi:hypothetical protein GGR58DRAFT_516023 [Xylaria digitata]|nr:hypothetical protein GGR58DRAFT_516023 [Xylaria digitata]